MVSADDCGMGVSFVPRTQEQTRTTRSFGVVVETDTTPDCVTRIEKLRN